VNTSPSLGIDIGSLHCHIAVRHLASTAVGAVDATRASSALSLVALGPDDGLVCGHQAQRIAAVSPARSVSDLLARLEDPHLVTVGDRRIAPEELLATLIDDIIVRELGNVDRSSINLGCTYPARFADHHVALLDRAVRLSGVEHMTLMAHPIAVAHEMAARNCDGDAVMIVDIGANSCDLSIIDRDSRGALSLREGSRTLLGLGGFDVDRLIFEWVDRQCAGVLSGADRDDDAAAASIAAVLRDCAEAKEAMSTATSDVVTVVDGCNRVHITLNREVLVALIDSYVACIVVNINDKLRGLKRANRVDSVIVVGGGAELFGLCDALSAALPVPVIQSLDGAALAAQGVARVCATQADRAVMVAPTTHEGPEPTDGMHHRRGARRAAVRGTSHAVRDGAPSNGRGRRRALGATGVVVFSGAAWIANASAASRNDPDPTTTTVASSITSTSPSSNVALMTPPTTALTVAAAPTPIVVAPPAAAAPSAPAPVQVVLVPVPTPVPTPAAPAAPASPPPAPSTRATTTTTRPLPPTATVTTIVATTVPPPTVAPTTVPATTSPPTTSAPSGTEPPSSTPATAAPTTTLAHVSSVTEAINEPRSDPVPAA
jgi:molecular chaperone DnaK